MPASSVVGAPPTGPSFSGPSSGVCRQKAQPLPLRRQPRAHRAQITWRQHGLALVEDLGQVWERKTSAPLPLGGILARHNLGVDTIRTVTDVLRDSLAYAHTHREDTVPTMRRHAQELTREVMFKHVDLYVNHWTTDLSDTGRAALEVLGRKAAEVGMLPPSTPPLVVL